MKDRKQNMITLFLSILLPLAVGGIAAAITSDAMTQFNSMNKPPLAPPGWLFPIAWTILYILMGVSCYRIYIYQPVTAEDVKNRNRALTSYLLQLFFNFFWCLLFFKGGMYLFSFVWLLIMLALIIMMYRFSSKIDKIAARCLIPYIIWTVFAGYLNIAIALIN